MKDDCKARFGQRSKRDTPLSRRQDFAANSSSNSEVFSLVDKDGSGNVTFDEYVLFVHYKYPDTKDNRVLLSQWVKYFRRYGVSDRVLCVHLLIGL